ncbi:MAG: SDR family oxidoreductase [Bacteroidota bacterium]
MLPIDLKDKVAIVTGSTQGIGLGIARMLAKAGCHVAGCGISSEGSEKAKNFKSVVEVSGCKAFYQSIDVKKEADILQFVQAIKAFFGKIDILISNAGKNMFTAPENCSIDFWTDDNHLNLRSHWLMSKACHADLKANKGFILFMTSNHAYSTLTDCFPYNVSKAGIVGMVKALAIQWGPEIRIVGMAPGFIQTEGADDWFGSFPDPEAKRQEVLSIHPTRNFGNVDEIGAFCAFLASPFANFITGTTYLIDGGRSALMQDV